MTRLKARSIPFSIGTTSYIWPSDILTNVRRLAPLVDDIELLSFESDHLAPYPSFEQVDELRSIACTENLSYTVHLPVDIDLTENSTQLLLNDLDKIKRCIDCYSSLSPFAYNLHLSKIKCEKDWHTTVCALEELSRFIDPKYICIENTDFDLAPYLPTIDSLGFSHCCDIGHLNVREEAYLEYLDRARVVHLHGVEGKRDHRSLLSFDRAELMAIVDRLKSRTDDFVMTIEVFSEDKLMESLHLLEDIYGQ